MQWNLQEDHQCLRFDLPDQQQIILDRVTGIIIPTPGLRDPITTTGLPIAGPGLHPGRIAAIKEAGLPVVIRLQADQAGVIQEAGRVVDFHLHQGVAVDHHPEAVLVQAVADDKSIASDKLESV